MPKNALFIFFLPFLSLLAACEREARIDLETLPPELVVIANFSDLDTMEVVVSKTRPVLEEQDVEYVSDAIVEVFIDGFFADRLEYVSSPVPQIPGYYLSSGVVAREKRHYRLTVDAPGFERAEAECTMPVPAGIDTGFTSLLIEKQEVDEHYNLATITVGVKVLNPEPPLNYYHLNFYHEGFDLSIQPNGDTLRTAFYSLPLITISNDDAIPVVPYIDNRGVLFTDDALSGNDGELSFSCSFQYRRSDQELSDFIIELRSVSPEYYLYHRSLALQYISGLDPFSEPVILYTNVKNGNGVFAGFISRFYRVEIK